MSTFTTMAIDDHMNVNKIGGIEMGITWIRGKVPQPHFSISYKWLACLIQLHTMAYTTLSTHAALWTHMDHKINTDSTFRLQPQLTLHTLWRLIVKPHLTVTSSLQTIEIWFSHRWPKLHKQRIHLFSLPKPASAVRTQSMLCGFKL